MGDIVELDYLDYGTMTYIIKFDEKPMDNGWDDTEPTVLTKDFVPGWNLGNGCTHDAISMCGNLVTDIFREPSVRSEIREPKHPKGE